MEPLKKKPKETRTEAVIFRVTKSEWKNLEQAAARAQLEPNAYAREKVLRGAVRLRQTRELPFAVTFELGRVGVNLNQLVRKFHMTDEYEPAELTAVCQRLDELLGVILATVTD